MVPRGLVVVGLLVMGACEGGGEVQEFAVGGCNPPCAAERVCDTSTGAGVCVDNICGNAIVEGEEACDGGDTNSNTEPDACRTDCTLARCGDQVVDTGEACEPGDPSDADGCLSTCACAGGYRGEGGTCVDVDECAGGSDNCASNGTCTNRVGSFTCACNTGYSGDGKTCVDIDECATGADDCSPDATCTNSGGGFTCQCRAGFLGTGTSCSDVDECAHPEENTCHTKAVCTNTAGGFTCACDVGYFGDGQLCAPCPLGEVNPVPGSASCTPCGSGTYDDGDEVCAAWAPPCRVDQQEVQAPGATGDRICTQRVDTDYCADAPCHNGGECINGVSSYLCDCESGYSGEHCEVSPESGVAPIDLCDSSPVGKVPNTTRSPKAVWVRGVQLGSTGVKRTIVEWDPVPGANHYWVQSTLHLRNQGVYQDQDWIVSDADHRNAFQSGFEFEEADPGWRFSLRGEEVVNYSVFFRDGDEVTVKVRATLVGPGGGETLLHSYPEYRFRLGGDYVVEKPLVWGRAGSQQATLGWCNLENADSYELAYGSNPAELTGSASVEKPAGASRVVHTVTGLSNQQTAYFVLYPLRDGVRGQPSETLEITPSDGSGSAEFDVSIHALTFNQATSSKLWPLNEGDTPVDRIAGKPGVFRVFLKHNLPDSPKVSVQLNLFDGEELLTSLRRTVALRDAARGDADSSDSPVLFELLDPAWLVEGASFSVEVDPAFELAETDETNNRYPAGEGTSSFGFVEAPGLKIRLIGTRSSHGESREITEGVKNQIKQAFLDMYPVKEVLVEVADDGAGNPVVLNLTGFDVDTSLGEVSDGELQGPLAVVKNYRSADINGDLAKMNVFYYALVKQGADLERTFTNGLALRNTLGESYAPVLVGIGSDEADTMIETMLHEVGHSHSAKHVQALDEPTNACGETKDSDITYPYNNYDESGASETEYGRIGKTGYIASQKRLVDKTYYNDVMSYCTYRSWISDHTYSIFRLFSAELDGRYGPGASPEGASSERAALDLQRSDRQEGTRLEGSYRGGQWRLGSVLHGKGRAAIPLKNNPFQMQVKTEDGGYWASVHPVALDHSESMLFEVFVPAQSPLREVTIYNEGGEEVFGVREPDSRAPVVGGVPVVPVGEGRWRLQPTAPVNRRVVRVFRVAAQGWFTLAVDRGTEAVLIQASRGDVLEVQWNLGLGVHREYITL